jgi:hypothetical protein
MEEDAVQWMDRYLYQLVYTVNSFRLKDMYLDRHDPVLIRMDNALLFAYYAWHHDGDAERALSYLERVQAACVERLKPVYSSKYHFCIAVLQGQLSRAPTPEPQHQDAHITAILQLLKSYISV